MDEKSILTELMKISNNLGLLRAEVATNTQITKSAEEQAKKTNGRVSKLEDDTVDLKKNSDQQHVLVSRLEGSFKAHQQYIEEKIKSSRDFSDREINELKKKVDKDSKFHTTETKEKNKTIREIVKHAITAGITLIASLTIGK